MTPYHLNPASCILWTTPIEKKYNQENSESKLKCRGELYICHHELQILCQPFQKLCVFLLVNNAANASFLRQLSKKFFELLSQHSCQEHELISASKMRQDIKRTGKNQDHGILKKIRVTQVRRRNSRGQNQNYIWGPNDVIIFKYD